MDGMREIDNKKLIVVDCPVCGKRHPVICYKVHVQGDIVADARLGGGFLCDYTKDPAYDEFKDAIDAYELSRRDRTTIFGARHEDDMYITETE